MIEYIVLIAFILILSVVFFFKKRPRKASVIFTAICFVAMFIMSSLRFRIGNDYILYSRGFFKMGMDGFDTLTYGRWELGFVLLTKIIVYFTRDIRVYLAVAALISLTGPFFVICKYSKKVWLSVLLYVNLYFFYLTMNFLRQSLAVSITMLAFPFLLKKKIFPYIIPYMAIVILASAFHISALLMVPVFFIVRIKLSYRVSAAYLGLTAAALVFSDAIMDAATKFEFITKYAYGYYKQSIFWTEGIDLIHLTIPSTVIATCIFLILKFAKFNRIITRYVNLMFFGYIFTTVMLKHAIVERVSYYAYIYVILYIPEFMLFIENIYKKRLRRKLKKFAAESSISAEAEKTDNESETAGDNIEAIPRNIINKYKKRKKAMVFCIAAALVAGTVSYNIYGLLSGDKGVHGVYPYQSWLYGSSGSVEE